MKPTTLTAFQFRLAGTIIHAATAEKLPLDRAYQKYFNKLHIRNAERGLIIGVIGDIFRRLNYYCFLGSFSMKQIPENITKMLEIWHLVNRLPQCAEKPAVPVDGDELRKFEEKLSRAKKMPALRDGCPDWLDALGDLELGRKWPAERKALAEAPRRFIRLNTLKADMHELKRSLSISQVGFRDVPGVENALEITTDASLFNLFAFKQGMFEQQDAGSQLIAPFLEAEPGMRVIDACSGSGGKTMHLAALMNGKGTIIAMDVEEWKLKDLKLRARRCGAFNIETRLIESGKTIKHLDRSADRVLLDVPCSGLGVLKRNPETKWRSGMENMKELYDTQEKILAEYSRMVKPGGKLVYSTCSIMPEENELQIKAFLDDHPGEWELEEKKNVYPSKTGFDGFFMARLRRLEKPAVKEENQQDA